MTIQYLSHIKEKKMSLLLTQASKLQESHSRRKGETGRLLWTHDKIKCKQFKNHHIEKLCLLNLNKKMDQGKAGEKAAKLRQRPLQ